MRDRGGRATGKQMQVVVRVGLEPGTAGLRVGDGDYSAMLPPFTNVSANKTTKNYTCSLATRGYIGFFLYHTLSKITEFLYHFGRTSRFACRSYCVQGHHHLFVFFFFFNYFLQVLVRRYNKTLINWPLRKQ